MERSDIDSGNQTCKDAKFRRQLSTMKEAADLAHRSTEVEPLTIDEALEMRGSGWVGDIDTLRSADAT